MLLSCTVLRRLVRAAATVLVALAGASFAATPAPAADVHLVADQWVDSTGALAFDAVRGLPETLFRPAAGGRYAGLRPGQAQWLRLRVHVPRTGRWYLALPDTRLESATLWWKDGEAWQSLVAGDRLPVAQWPVPHASPLFPLDLHQQDATLWLRVEASNDISVIPELQDESAVSARQQHFALVQGAYLGLIGMVVLFAWSCAFVYRDRAYLWLGSHALLVCLVVARVVGIAGLEFWPEAARWNDVSEHVLSMLCMAPLAAFVAVCISLRGRSARAYWALCALAALAVAAAAAAAALPMPWRVHLATTVVLGLAAVCLGVLGWAWWRGDRFARWVLLAFSPMLVGLPFPIGRWLQLIPQDLLTEHAIQVGLGVTLPAVLLLLVVRSQERSDYRRRISRIEQVDPLTGLVNDQVFERRLAGLLRRSARLGHQSAVVVIELSNLGQLGQEFGRRKVQEVMLRVASRLTNLMRPMDTVARIGERRYGVLMEGPVPPDRSAQLASKIMARLILPFGGLPKGLLVQPRIAVVLVPLHAATEQEALDQAEALLDEAPPSDRRSIYVADTGGMAGGAAGQAA